VSAVHDTGGRESTERLRLALNVELIPGRPIERAAAVRPDLGRNPALAEEDE
jgi:hypothetical protein